MKIPHHTSGVTSLGPTNKLKLVPLLSSNIVYADTAVIASFRI